MTGYWFFRSLTNILGFGVIVLMGLGVLGHFIYSQLATEARFRNSYRPEWRERYEKNYGSLSQAHTKIGVSVVGIFTIVAVAAWLCKVVRGPDHSKPTHNRKTKHRRRFGSSIERIVYY